jgi:hypothetical protein
MYSNKLRSTLAITFIIFFAACKKDKYVALTSQCPTVVTTSPVNLATNVPLSQIITATFNEKLNPATVNALTFKVQGASGSIAGSITYNDSNKKISFTPVSKLSANTTYTSRITSSVKDMMGNALQTDYIWTFSTGAMIIPMITSADPANKDSNVVLNKTINASFNIAMDPLTINTNTYTLKQGTNVIAGSVLYTGNTASFDPSINLLPSTNYTATITTGAKNIDGTSMASNYTWTFTTGTIIAPKVVSADPANNATAVVINKTISANFNMPMNPTTLNGTTFTLKQGATPIAGAVSYLGTLASFDPTNNLIPSTTYTATITTGAKNLAGIPTSTNYIWSFTTGTTIAPKVILTNPLNNASSVPYNKVIDATFNMPMDASTINSTNYTLYLGAVPISGTVTYIGNTASFKPLLNLLAGQTYTATIKNTAKNAAGIYLANPYTWTFATLLLDRPTVTSTDPKDNETNVVLNKIVSANFSTAMDASSINSSTFTVKLGAASVAGTVSYIGTKASFTPTNNFQSGNIYTATITSNAKNALGAQLANDYIWTFSTKTPLGPKSPNLKSVAQFGIIAGTAVTNNAGFSIINDMNVGISPGVRSSLTGFPPAKIVNGAIYAADDASPVPAMLTQAKTDLTNAYLFAEGATTPAPATVSGDQGGKTLAPGIYKSTSTLLIQSGNLTLDGKGDQNAVWIFQISSDFTTIGGAGGNIILIGGAQAKNIYWQTGSSATIGDNTAFYGNVLALTSITMNSKATATGRMLARNGAVVMTSTNTINKP